MATCQAARSPAKHSPAMIRGFHGKRAAPAGRGDRRIHSHSGAAARATRQNALAVGPVSDRRTKIGANAMAAAPRSRAATGSLFMAQRGPQLYKSAAQCPAHATLQAVDL